jgi:hypothetical protein
VILIVVIVCVALAGGYFLIKNKHNRPDFNSMQNNEFEKKGFNQTLNLDEETKSQIISFFESNPDESAINNYCVNNPMYCFYYCKEINPSQEICSKTKPPVWHNETRNNN